MPGTQTPQDPLYLTALLSEVHDLSSSAPVRDLENTSANSCVYMTQSFGET